MEKKTGVALWGIVTILLARSATALPPPVIVDHGIIGGSNAVITWTSDAGQTFDLVESFDLLSWSNLTEKIPAVLSSNQTSYTVTVNETADSRFFRVKRRRPPNVILLFADDLGYGDLACYGHPYAKTPNLDKLAAQGTQFLEFNVTGNTCNPSRTGILTSWHPRSYHLNTGNYGFNQKTDYDPDGTLGYEDHPTVMELLHNEGYRTGHFGKWHIGPGTPTNGTYGIDEIDVMGGSGPRGRDELIYEAAIDFIVANQNTNFYLNVMGRVTHHVVAPDTNLVASAGYTNLYTYFDRNDFEGQQIQDMFDNIIANGGNITNSMANYLTEVYYLDVFIGELLDKLDELGIADDTIIAFSSDQGAAPVPDSTTDMDRLNLIGWSGGLRGQKHTDYEGGIRSPFILRWPGHVPAGKVNTNSVTSALDWLPTLCQIAGVDVSGVDIQGESVLDIWEGSDRSRNDPQFWIYSLKKDNWRAYFPKGGSTTMLELYDLSTDFSETNNLVLVRTNMVTELTTLWADWLATLP